MSRIAKFARPSGVAVVLVLSLVLPGTVMADPGGNDRNNKEFATGSGKADLTTFDEHMSFTAHSLPDSTGQCLANGSVVYTRETTAGIRTEIKADVVRLVISPDTATGPHGAFIVGEIKSGTINGVPITQQYAWFDVFDSTMQGGTGDLVRLETLTTVAPCLGPLGGDPITSGNVVIEAEALQIP